MDVSEAKDESTCNACLNQADLRCRSNEPPMEKSSAEEVASPRTERPLPSLVGIGE